MVGNCYPERRRLGDGLWEGADRGRCADSGRALQGTRRGRPNTGKKAAEKRGGRKQAPRAASKGGCTEMARCATAAFLVLSFATVLCGREPAPHKTDWFAQAKYGVFVHYLNGLQNNPEHVASLNRRTTWDECVKEFDTERFAERMKEAGAGYVIFTVMQGERFMIAPNATFDRLTGYQPGEACATRDLIEDLCRSLGKRDIPLMLYWTGDGPRRDPQAAQTMGFAGGGRFYGIRDQVGRRGQEIWSSLRRPSEGLVGGRMLSLDRLRGR